MKFKFYRQYDSIDCGPTCLKMIAQFYGKNFDLEYLRENCYLSKEGVSVLGISEGAENIGFRTFTAKLTLDALIQEAPLPAILHWNQNHFVILYSIKRKISSRNNKYQFYIADPAHGKVIIDINTFSKCWISDGGNKGISILLEPTDDFYKKSIDENLPAKKNKGFAYLSQFLTPYRKYIIQILCGMLFSSLLSLIFPFLTQSLVDFGINRSDLNFTLLILLSQLGLLTGQVLITIIRNWIVLHMNTRISISIIASFLMKLMRLPMKFYDTKSMGDLTQRINDHSKIELFLTGTSINTLFGIINIIVFSIVLGIYNFTILSVFLIGSFLSVSWIALFMEKRRILDYARFQKQKDNQDAQFEILNGMQEIKLNNCESTKRWDWERVQAKVYKLNISSLALEQYQQLGSFSISQIKNIGISYLAARYVINGQMTLGMMLSISYIIGQLNSPLEQLMNFFKSAQDASLSLNRFMEVQDKENEETDAISYKHADDASLGDIVLKNVSFQYNGPKSPYVLKNLSLNIPHNKVTAIVGDSGSGKTTLLKLLLRFYAPTQGEIYVGEENLTALSPKWWRKQCGTVMQDGYLFANTIANNIALDSQKVEKKAIVHAAKVANIEGFIESLPLKYNSKIGASGNGISAGQKQRILIARAIYKNPKYLFFDEATSALDANNESIIVKNLNEYFSGKTVLVIAHRLSTIKNADQVIVLKNGQIVEIGTHMSLVDQQGYYFELVKNQLEIGV